MNNGLKVAVFSAHAFEEEYLIRANANAQHNLVFVPSRLTVQTAYLARGCQAVSLFTTDQCTSEVLDILQDLGVRFIALRTAGFNNVDLHKAQTLGIKVARVPAYSPHAIAEHAVALMLALNRKLIRAHRRMMELDFTLDGLTGFDMNGKTVGIVGTGEIGIIMCKIMHGFGCRILAYDLDPNDKLEKQYDVIYTDLDDLCRRSDIISLHLPLNPNTRYLIDARRIGIMKKGVMIINTSRGAIIHTQAAIAALKSGHIGSLGIDVYEEEEGIFFEDHSDDDVLQDDVIARLMTFKNVLITAHQGFLTDTALRNIAETTVDNLNTFISGRTSENFLSD